MKRERKNNNSSAVKKFIPATIVKKRPRDFFSVDAKHFDEKKFPEHEETSNVPSPQHQHPALKS